METWLTNYVDKKIVNRNVSQCIRFGVQAILNSSFLKVSPELPDRIKQLGVRCVP